MILIIGIICGIAVGALAGSIIGSALTDRYGKTAYENAIRERERFHEYYMLMNQWVILKQAGDTIVRFFTERGLHTVVIYGLTELGDRLYDELKNSEVKVLCAADAGVFTCPYPELKLIHYDEFEEAEEFKVADVIVVTPVFAYEAIKNDLSSYTNSQIISISDVFDEL